MSRPLPDCCVIMIVKRCQNDPVGVREGGGEGGRRGDCGLFWTFEAFVKMKSIKYQKRTQSD